MITPEFLTRAFTGPTFTEHPLEHGKVLGPKGTRTKALQAKKQAHRSVDGTI